LGFLVGGFVGDRFPVGGAIGGSAIAKARTLPVRTVVTWWFGRGLGVRQAFWRLWLDGWSRVGTQVRVGFLGGEKCQIWFDFGFFFSGLWSTARWYGVTNDFCVTGEGEIWMPHIFVGF